MPTCPVHHKEMIQRVGNDGNPWWSCGTKVGGVYCPWKSSDGETIYQSKPKRQARWTSDSALQTPGSLPQEPIPAPPTAPEYNYHPPIPVTRPQATQDAPRTQTKPEVDWDAVNRLSASQTALNAAAQAYQGAGLEGETSMYQCFAMNYKLLMGCKIGGEVDQLIESIAHVKPREPEAF